MADQENHKSAETHISQPQWLPNDFVLGTAIEGPDSFFESLVQGMNLLSITYGGPFDVKSLRQACSEYAKAHQAWHQVIIENAVKGGYAMSRGQQADFDSYLVRIQLTAKEMSVLKIPGHALRGRPNIEGRILCQKYGIQLHVIEKRTIQGEEVVFHVLFDDVGSRPVSADENIELYNQSRIIHIVNEEYTHFVPVLPKITVYEEPIQKQGQLPLVEGAYSQPNQLDGTALHPVQSVAPVSVVIHSPHMLPLSDPSSPQSKLDPFGEEENVVGSKKKSADLPEETETFQAQGVKQFLHGIAYQWKLLMLFACNSHQLGYDFRLATEMNAAEKFDDVVLQYVKEGSDIKHCRFLQAKHFHTESKKITADDLFMIHDDKFSLQKYFPSYQKIKRNLQFQSAELQDFIICTNGDFDIDNNFQHQSLKKLHHNKWPLYLEPVAEADDMLNVGGERYRIVSSSHPERKAVVSVIKSTFDKTSDCRKLAEKLAERILSGKKINLDGLFKEYHIPLASYVFNIRENKLAKKFVEDDWDNQSCPGAHAFREALHDAIEGGLKRWSTKQQILPPELTHPFRDTGSFWNDIGKCELKFSGNFRKAFIPHPEPQIQDPTSLAGEISRLINSQKTDEEIKIDQGKEKIITQELPHLAGHVFVKKDANVVFSHKFLTGDSLAGNLQDLRNALFKTLEVNNCQELTNKLSNCTFNITNFETCKEGDLKGFSEPQVTDEEVEEFLDHLIFAVSQPNEERLSKLISDRLGQELNLIDGHLITSDFQSRMVDWLTEIQGSYQSNKTVGKFFSDLREKVCQLILVGPTFEHVKKLEKYGIQFNEDALPAALKKFLGLSQPANETSVFNYITDPKQTFLGSIKVNQVMKDVSAYKTQGSFIFIKLKNLLLLEEKALMAFSKESTNLLIVECKVKPAAQIETLCRKLSEIMKKKSGKKVILIAPHNHPLASQFKTGEHSIHYQEMVDEFKFGDLTSDSKQKLLEKTVIFQGSEIALNELMSVNSAITKQLSLVRLLEGKKLKIGQPVPVSNGYDEGYYIGRTLNYQIYENTTSYSADNFDKLIQQAQCQKVMLISDTAGMGKTTILTHLAKQVKQNFPSHWVARFDLNDHTVALDDQSKQKIGAVEFLAKKLLKLDSHLEKELFEQCLNAGKLVLMLDGFDEICPSYEETVLSLLRALKETPVEQLWITTRPHLRKTLESNLQQLSYTLEPFSKDNQVEFLTKFWSKMLQPQGTSPQMLEMYATALIVKLKQSIRDRDKDFTSIPLQTRLLAEAFKESDISEHKLPDKLDLLDLYKRFTERKCDICQEEKMKIIMSNVAVKELRQLGFKNFTEQHQRLALQVLFPKEIEGIFKDISQTALQGQGLAKYGIVHYIDNKPHFIQSTFAEYYVADLLINQMTKKTTTAGELQDFLLKEILLKENYQVICSFLDGFLEKFKLSKVILEQSGKRINELWKDDASGVIGQRPLNNFGRTNLHQAAQAGHSHIIRYLLDSLRAGQHLKTMHDLLLAKDQMGKTAWHLSAESGHLKASEELWNWAKESNVNIKDELLLAKDNEDQTAWHLASWNKRSEVLIKLLEYAEAEVSQKDLKNLLLSKDKEGKTVWHLASWKNFSKVFQNLMVWAEKANLNQEEFKGVLLKKDNEGRTPWHSATLNNHPEAYELVYRAIKTPQEQNDLLKELFLDKDNDEQTIWHIAARSIHPDVFRKLMEVAENVLTKEQLWELLLTKDQMGQTAWHLSAENGRANALNTLWEWAKKVHLNQNEVKNNWLLSHDSRGTAWHLAARRGHVNVLKKLWDWAREMNLNLKEDLLLIRDVAERTAGHLAAEQGNPEALDEIFHLAKEANLDSAVDLLLAKDLNEQTPLDLLKDCPFISEGMKEQVFQQWNSYLTDA